MKNKPDSLFFTRLFVSERKQIALIRHEKLFEISRAVLRDKSLRNEDNMKENVRAWISVIIALIIALTVFCKFSAEGMLWNRVKEERVSAQELAGKTSDTYIGRPAAEDIRQVKTASEYESMMNTVDTFTMTPKSITPTGVYSLGKWCDAYRTYRRKRSGSVSYRKREIETNSMLAGLWGEYTQYYLVELEDGSHVLAQMNSCIAEEVAAGEKVLLPIGHKIAFSQKAKTKLAEICAEKGVATDYVFYAVDDNWQKENANALFFIRAGVDVICFIIVVIVIMLITGKLFGTKRKETCKEK